MKKKITPRLWAKRPLRPDITVVDRFNLREFLRGMTIIVHHDDELRFD